MTNCDDYQELISRLLDGDLSKAERAELAEHVKSCPDCAAVYVAFRSLSEHLGEDLEEVPSALHETIMADVRREGLRARNSAHRAHRTWHYVLTAAACLVLLVSAGLSLPKIVGRQKDAAPSLGAAPRSTESVVMAEESEADSFRTSDQASNTFGDYLSDAEPAEEAADDAPLKAPRPEPAADVTLQLDEDQSAALLERMTREQVMLSGTPEREISLSYLDGGKTCALTVLLNAEEAVYVSADGDIYYRIDAAPGELLDLLGLPN